jgi:hypothetical protein
LEELLGSGLGAADDDGDEYDENEDALEDQTETQSKKARGERRELPKWLAEVEVRSKALIKETEDSKTGLSAPHRPYRRPLPSSSIRETPQTIGFGSFFLPRNDEIHLYIGSKLPTPAEVYNPPIFFWDPLPLVEGGICCPSPECSSRNGQSKLSRWGWARRLRRVNDFDENIYLLGRRYICNKKGGGCGRTLTSWAPSVLKMLPSTLQRAFPFYLTHRSGCTIAMLEHLRHNFATSASGATHFSNLVRSQHLHRYDVKCLNYLKAVLRRVELRDENDEGAVTYPDLGTYADTEGNCGFVPSAPWFVNIYNNYINSMRPHIEQHASMQSLDVLALDHSFKVRRFHFFRQFCFRSND